WPLTPRPAVFPLPEPTPRPTRIRFLRAPGLSEISFSFILHSRPVRPDGRAGKPSGFHDLDEMADLRDHAAYRGRVLEVTLARDLVQAETDQRCALRSLPALRAFHLLHADGFLAGH